MAVTNLQQWNPTAANQETDVQYAADSQRSGGATNPSIFDATLANKLFYQLTTYVTALFQAFAAKGFATSDASLGTLTAQCANFLTTADAKPGLQSVAYSPAPQFNCATANGFEVALTGNVTGLTIINTTAGQQVVLIFTQSGSGGYTVAWPSNVHDAGTVDPGVGNTSQQLFEVRVNGSLYALGPMTVVS
jgi:hypothetical protein